MSVAASLMPPAPMAEPSEARRVCANGSEVERVALAASASLAPEMLYFLAGDRAASVRAAVAANPATPAQADQLLQADADTAVRRALARKLAAAAPRLAASTSDKLRHMAQETLNRLVRDAEVQVRAAIADAVKDLPDAPRDVIMALARDVAMPVAEPVLRFSPLLSESDLLALVTQPPADGTLSAIARRPHLAESLSDALVATGNAEAITALLGNGSARIREATLDQLIGQAAARTDWHAPMVRRPRLSPRAAAQLASIVADTLLRELAARTDLATATREALAAAVQRRLSPAAATPLAVASHGQEPSADEAMAEARGLAMRGELTEALLLEAAARAEVRRTTALLAAACGVPYSLVERAASLRSAKGLVSLCWKAGYGMRAAVAAQALLGRIPPAKLLQAGPGGAFPLAPDEMRWQIDVLTKMGR
jgi:uncharacterized protein (DUF2336 family)